MNNAIENLYATFKPYRIGNDFVRYDHCIDSAKSKKLAETPLRKLTSVDLEHYACKAMTTWGTALHFKHFLPRILELTIEYRDGFIDLAVELSKLQYAEWGGWSKQERDSVIRFFDEYWSYQLANPPQGLFDDGIDTVLCALANACLSVQRYLDKWLDDSSDSAKQQFAAFIHSNAGGLLKKGKLSNPFWDGRTGEAHREVIAWLQKDELCEYFSCEAEYDWDDELSPVRATFLAIRSSLKDAST